MEATILTGLIVIGLVAFRMLFVNPSWFFLPKSWQRWVFGKSYPPTYPFGKH